MAELGQDPAYLALLRALGFDDAQAKSNAGSNAGQVRAEDALQRPEIGYQGGITRETIGGNMEDRGMFRSGMHDVALGRQAHEESLQSSALTLATAGSLASIEQTLAERLAANRRRQAEGALAAGTNVYLEEGAARHPAY